MYYQVVEEHYENVKYNAGSKARIDATRIFSEMGFMPIEMTPHDASRASAGRIGKILGHMKAARDWKKLLRPLGGGDVVLLQLPLINHTLFVERAFASAKKRGLKVIGLIHDLEELRFEIGSGSEEEKERYRREGSSQRRLADMIIAHDAPMKSFLVDKLGMAPSKVVTLGIFDYLLEEAAPLSESKAGVIAIAGNLKPEKAGYVYDLPLSPEFALYGKGFDGDGKKNVSYCGAFAPDNPGILAADYGLVWDGETAKTCTGFFGEYLKYNAPHKTSLYLSCGMPVIVWDQAAVADFVIKNGVGLKVSSLDEIDALIKSITKEEYEEMRTKAAALSTRLRNGTMLRNATIEALEGLDESFDN